MNQSMRFRIAKHWPQALIALVVAVVLACVTALYVQPEFVMNVAQQVWACF